MRALVGTLAVIALVAITLIAQSEAPAEAQDTSEARISALEVKVEQQVRQLVTLSNRLATVEAAVASSGSAGLEPSTGGGRYAITGSIELFDPDGAFDSGGPCTGTGGYNDLRQGATVTISDGAGNVLGLGRLSSGMGMTSVVCRFTFTVEELPRSDFYQVDVAGRDAPSYTFEEMQAANWTISLSIGD